MARVTTRAFWSMMWSLSVECGVMGTNGFLHATLHYIHDLEDDMVKYLVPIPTILFPSPPHPNYGRPHPHYIVPIRIPACLSVFCYNCCPPPNPDSLFLALHIIFLHLVFWTLLTSFSVECRYHYRKTPLLLPRYYCIIFSVSTVLRWNLPYPHGGTYHGYHGISAFLVTVSSSDVVCFAEMV